MRADPPRRTHPVPVSDGRPDHLADYRRIEVWLEDKQEIMVLLTNRLDLSAATIAAILQTALADRAVLQGAQAKPAHQNLRGNKCQCRSHPDLDSTHHHPAGQIPAVQIPPHVGSLASDRAAALESVQLPGPVGVAGADRFKLHRSCRPKRSSPCVLDSIPYHRSHTNLFSTDCFPPE